MDTRLNDLQTGWTVYGRDGDKIGDIEEVGPNYLLVTKGLIFITDLYIPTSAIDTVDANEGAVFLTVDKATVEDQGWTEPPSADASDWAATTTATEARAAASDVGYETDAQSVRVPLHEEELRAERTVDTAGEVRVGKNVVEEQREFDVPVTREEVEVRRVSTDRPAGASSEAFVEGDTIRVPVSAERIEVTKEPRVVEEIEISKRPVTETQRVSETVRREEVDVDETGNVLAGSAASMTGARRDLDDDRVGSTSLSTRDTEDSADDDDPLRR